MKKNLLLIAMCLFGICNICAQRTGGTDVVLRIVQSPTGGDDPDHGGTPPDPRRFRVIQYGTAITVLVGTGEEASVKVYEETTGAAITAQRFSVSTALHIKENGTYTIRVISAGTEVRGQFTINKNAQTDPVEDDTLFPMLPGLCRTMYEKLEYHIEGRDTTDYEYHLYRTEAQKDTMINEKHYLQYEKNIFLREEDKKVLLYSGNCTKKDLVLYDFNLKVGDGLAYIYEVHDGECFTNTKEGTLSDSVYVTKIETIVLQDGKEYKKWVFDNGMEYAEGIGTCGDNLFAGDFFQLITRTAPFSLRERSLVCACKSGKLLYEMNPEEQSRKGAWCLCEQKAEKAQWCDQWNVFEFRGVANDEETEQRTWLYTLSEDTIINAQKYRQILRQPSWKSGDIQYVGAMRATADDKVYFHYEDSEYLLYDFGAKTGDTLIVFAGLNNAPSIKTQRVVVDATGPLDPSRIHMCIRIVPDEYRPEGDSTNWVWGVGTQQGLLQTGGYGLPGGYSYALLCAYQQGECVYTAMGDYQPFYARYNCKYNKEGTGVENVLTNKYFTLQGRTLTLDAGAEARLYDISGRCLLQTTAPTMELDAQMRGVYVLQVLASGKADTYKVAL